MKPELKHEGVVVPMVTPLTRSGQLDETAADRLVDLLLAAKVQGVFVLGTTGEGGAVPMADRRRLVERVAKRVKSQALVYAGLGDLKMNEVADEANSYLEAGAHALVARPPVSLPEADLLSWFASLLDGVHGPLMLYNIPAVSQVSIPLEVIDQLTGHPRLIGLKDSENNPDRLRTIMEQFGRRSDFSILVGVGKLMEQGLRLGAHGIVPSVGNLIPETCRQLWECARCGDWVEAKLHADRMTAVAGTYQVGRNLGQSLSALKGALSVLGVCEKYMLPPLQPLDDSELQAVRDQLARLHLQTEPKTGQSCCSAIHQPSTGVPPTL